MEPSRKSFKSHSLKSAYLRQEPHGHAFALLRASLILSKDSGSALVFALVFIFIVLATSLAISNRGMFGLFGSVFNQESKLSREAADIGILRAVMLLNEPRNRELLVHASEIDGLTGNQIVSGSEYKNPCPGSGTPDLTASASSMGIKDSAGNVAGYPTFEIDDGSATGGIQRKFRIVSITQTGIPSLSGGTTGGIRISVQGQAIKAGKVVSTSTISRELEVIEKCCGLSLGGPSQVFGGDSRLCDQSNPGLGLIAGTYYKSNGLFNTVGGSGITFRDENGDPISQVYCLDTSDTNDCADGGLNSGTDTELVEVDPKLNDVPPIPSLSGTGASSCEGLNTSNCAISINNDTTLSTADFANWGSSTTLTTCTLSTCIPSTTIIPVTASISSVTTTTVANVQQCSGRNTPVASCRNANDEYTTTPSLTSSITNFYTVTVGTITVTNTPGLSTTVVGANPELAELKSHCFQTISAGVTVTYCSLDRIEIANNKILNIDTTGGPIRFYFPNPSTSPPSIELKNGNSGIKQTNLLKSPLSYTDLIFFGIPRSEIASKCTGTAYATACQQVELGGGTASSTSFFAYFPGAEVTLKGTATLNGVLWSNIINATGSVNFVTSSSGVGEVLSLIGMGDQGSSGGGNLNVLGEYVTRLTRKFTFF